MVKTCNNEDSVGTNWVTCSDRILLSENINPYVMILKI